MLKKKWSDDQRGFSLIELLVALSILMIITAPLLHGFLTSARVNSKARKVLEATTVGSNILEQLKSVDLNQVSGSDITVTKDSNGVYRLLYVNQEVDGKKYTAVVTADPTPYQMGSAGTVAKYNDEVIPEIYDMNAAQSAFFIESANEAADMADEFGTDTITILNSFVRTQQITIKNDLNKVYIDYDCYYTYNGRRKYAVSNLRLYSGTTDSDPLQNIYLLFEPMYSAGSSDLKEFIQIENTDNYPVNVYLVKQENTNSTAVNEAQYQVDVNVLETRTEFLVDGELTFVTNLRTNLLPSSQLQLHYNNASNQIVNGTNYSAQDLLNVRNLTQGIAKDRIFEITVDVYEIYLGEGDVGNEKVATVEGTKEE
ncbi:MAG: prepilin-type N-terminal cleavage/methylation domain-containing protein [Lachnospiraceae bacterium]